MTTRLALIGSDERTAALAERLSPAGPVSGGRFEIARWGNGPGDEADLSEQAGRAGVPVVSWQQAVSDPSVEAVVVAGQPAERQPVVIQALRYGKVVVCPPPCATSEEDLEGVEQALRESGGALLAVGDTTASFAGRRALSAITAGSVGEIHAIFGAARRRIGAPDTAEGLWDLLDFVTRCAGAPERGHAMAGDFGAILATLRMQSGTVVTLEVAASLPQTFPADREVEVEISGALAAIRIEPNNGALRLSAAESLPTHRPWQNRPAELLLDDLEAAFTLRPEPEVAMAHQRDLVRAMTIVKSAL